MSLVSHRAPADLTLPKTKGTKMRVRGAWLLLVLVVSSAGGCLSAPRGTNPLAEGDSGNGFGDRMASYVTSTIQKPWAAFAGEEKPASGQAWEWQTAAPVAKRADTVVPTIENSRLVALLPEL